MGTGGVGDMGVVALLRDDAGPKVVKADMVLLGELAQMGPSPFGVGEVTILDVSMTIGVVSEGE